MEGIKAFFNSQEIYSRSTKESRIHCKVKEGKFEDRKKMQILRGKAQFNMGVRRA